MDRANEAPSVSSSASLSRIRTNDPSRDQYPRFYRAMATDRYPLTIKVKALLLLFAIEIPDAAARGIERDDVMNQSRD